MQIIATGARIVQPQAQSCIPSKWRQVHPLWPRQTIQQESPQAWWLGLQALSPPRAEEPRDFWKVLQKSKKNRTGNPTTKSARTKRTTTTSAIGAKTKVTRKRGTAGPKRQPRIALGGWTPQRGRTIPFSFWKESEGRFSCALQREKALNQLWVPLWKRHLSHFYGWLSWFWKQFQRQRLDGTWFPWWCRPQWNWWWHEPIWLQMTCHASDGIYYRLSR